MDDEGNQPSLFQMPKSGLSITSEVTGNTYVIGNVIGEGGFGVVFECEDVWKNKLVAKVLKPRPQYINLDEIAVDEINKLLHVRHPNITHVFDAFKFDHGCYIISERCDRTLLDLMSGPNFDGAVWCMPLARCLLQAVHFAHVQRLVHCDIHAGNVLVRFVQDELLPEKYNALTFKLGDFGLAKAFGALDADGMFLDSIRPPEAINVDEFGPIDHRVDIYHVALLLLQVQLGEPLAFTRAEILEGAPRERALMLDSPYSFALEKALRRHVIYRTASAMELWRDLNSPAS